jgi:hypothetical protein
MSKKNKPKKYIYKDKDAFYAKYVFGEMTLRDVLNVILQKGYSCPPYVAISLDGDSFKEFSFKIENEELQICPRGFYFNPLQPHIFLWFNLNEQAIVREDEIEVKPLKGTKKKKAKLKFFHPGFSEKLKTVSILERTRPND